MTPPGVANNGGLVAPARTASVLAGFEPSRTSASRRWPRTRPTGRRGAGLGRGPGGRARRDGRCPIAVFAGSWFGRRWLGSSRPGRPPTGRSLVDRGSSASDLAGLVTPAARHDGAVPVRPRRLTGDFARHRPSAGLVGASWRRPGHVSAYPPRSGCVPRCRSPVCASGGRARRPKLCRPPERLGTARGAGPSRAAASAPAQAALGLDRVTGPGGYVIAVAGPGGRRAPRWCPPRPAAGSGWPRSHTARGR